MAKHWNNGSVPWFFTTPLLRIPASCITGGERRGDEGGTGVDDKAKQRRKQRIGVGVSHAREGLAVPLTRCHATSVPLHVLRSRAAASFERVRLEDDARKRGRDPDECRAPEAFRPRTDEHDKQRRVFEVPRAIQMAGKRVDDWESSECNLADQDLVLHLGKPERCCSTKYEVRRRRAHAMSKSIRWVIFLKTGDAKDSRSRWRNLLAKEKLNVRATLHQGVTHDCAPQTSQNQEMCMIQA